MLTREQAIEKVREYGLRNYSDHPMIVKHGFSVYEDEIFAFQRGYLISYGPTPPPAHEPPLHIGGNVVVIVDRFTEEMFELPDLDPYPKIAWAYNHTYGTDIETMRRAMNRYVKRIE